MLKHLIASGCSFTFEPWNWPTFVAQDLNLELTNVGMASTGNGLISRKVIIQVEELLKTLDPSEILVGVMWSGPDRIHKFKDPNSSPIPVVSDWIENPTNLWPDGEKVWEIGNGAWDTEFDQAFLKYIHTNEDVYMNTIDNILLVQNYLKSKNIKYFMSTFVNIFKHIEFLHKDVKNYFEFVDLSTFADTKGCWEWCKFHENKEQYIGRENFNLEYGHPYEAGHEAYAKEVLLPFIKRTKRSLI
jgi:hypothetical protein